MRAVPGSPPHAVRVAPPRALFEWVPPLLPEPLFLFFFSGGSDGPGASQGEGDLALFRPCASSTALLAVNQCVTGVGCARPLTGSLAVLGAAECLSHPASAAHEAFSAFWAF
jgi:hypothetical protein